MNYMVFSCQCLLIYEFDRTANIITASKELNVTDIVSLAKIIEQNCFQNFIRNDN